MSSEGENGMKKYYLTAAAVCLAMLAAFGFATGVFSGPGVRQTLKVGFIYENDGSTPFTYNFMLAELALKNQYPDQVQILTKSNVQGNETEEPLRELANKGCGIVFINTDSTQVRAVAEEYPNVQFCQISVGDDASSGIPANYHTFGGEIYQGRYVSGIAAGMKLRQMIDEGAVAPDRALVGFVGAFPVAEVISGYTAFLLGVRSVVPQAVMKVRYTYTWSSYTQEKACARALIEEGCAIISQHTNTIGPAVACEEALGTRTVVHVGYNQNMIDVAPAASLISTRINWTPYVTQAVDAVLYGRTIEKAVKGHAHGNDMSAGFAEGWVEIMELNKYIAAEGTQEAVSSAEDAFRRGAADVFRGPYTGVNPADSGDVYDLTQGYAENRSSSAPSFHYVLRDIVEEEN